MLTQNAKEKPMNFTVYATESYMVRVDHSSKAQLVEEWEWLLQNCHTGTFDMNDSCDILYLINALQRVVKNPKFQKALFKGKEFLTLEIARMESEAVIRTA